MSDRRHPLRSSEEMQRFRQILTKLYDYREGRDFEVKALAGGYYDIHARVDGPHGQEAGAIILTLLVGWVASRDFHTR